jgi:hypothetical protein
MKNFRNIIGLGVVVLTFSIVSCTKDDDCKYCYYNGSAGEESLGELCGNEINVVESTGYVSGGVTYDVDCREE